MSKFVINEKDPVHVIANNLQKSILSIRKERYDVILIFMNELLGKKHKSLRFFTNMKYDDIDIENMTKTINKHKNEIKKKLNIDVKSDNTKKYLFTLIKDMLKKIEYSLVKVRGDQFIYNILDKSP